MKEETSNALIEIVGEKNYTDKIIDMIAYAKDASQNKYRPDAAV